MITGPSYVAQPDEYDNNSNPRGKTLTGRFDSESFLIGVNNHASKCMINTHKRFVSFDPMKNRMFKEVGSIIRALGRGTLCWKVEDNEGRIHVLNIKG